MWIRGVHLGRRDIVEILLAIALIGGTAALAFTDRSGKGWFGALLPRFGFGPDWQCTWTGKGDPVCVKEPDKSEKPGPH